MATFNLHAGVDGWGRRTRVIEHARSLDADVLITPELWRGDAGDDLFHRLCTEGEYRGVFAPLARAERHTSGSGGPGWQPRWAHVSGERGLFFSEFRGLSRAQEATRNQAAEIEAGTWGLALFTRLEMLETRVIPLGRLRRERVTRALVLARLEGSQGPFWVGAVHGAHLSHGSHHQYRRINEEIGQLTPTLPTLLGGDFNAWYFALRVILPGWQPLVRGRTWPAARPHSQIDHLLARGPWRVSQGFTSDGGSDHRAVVADVNLR